AYAPQRAAPAKFALPTMQLDRWGGPSNLSAAGRWSFCQTRADIDVSSLDLWREVGILPAVFEASGAPDNSVRSGSGGKSSDLFSGWRSPDLDGLGRYWSASIRERAPSAITSKDRRRYAHG